MQALQSIGELNAYMDEMEVGAIRRALELGATKEEIAYALRVTRQGVDYKLRRDQARRAAKDQVEQVS